MAWAVSLAFYPNQEKSTSEPSPEVTWLLNVGLDDLAPFLLSSSASFTCFLDDSGESDSQLSVTWL